MRFSLSHGFAGTRLTAQTTGSARETLENAFRGCICFLQKSFAEIPCPALREKVPGLPLRVAWVYPRAASFAPSGGSVTQIPPEG